MSCRRVKITFIPQINWIRVNFSNQLNFNMQEMQVFCSCGKYSISLILYWAACSYSWMLKVVWWRLWWEEVHEVAITTTGNCVKGEVRTAFQRILHLQQQLYGNLNVSLVLGSHWQSGKIYPIKSTVHLTSVFKFRVITYYQFLRCYKFLITSVLEVIEQISSQIKVY